VELDTGALRRMAPLCETLGIDVVGADPQLVELALDWRLELCTANGLLHGGVILALADTAGALIAFLNLPAGASTATIESKTNFFRAVRDGRVTATARPLHVGSSTIVAESEVRDASGRLAAKVTQTQAVLQPS
jgi:1,4-dihydroxy-2-naphthoyl-CoA hydrolase